jgi:precorrin-6A/cobalt-precorrin-6A reductase
MRQNAVAAAGGGKIPLLMVERPAWQRAPGDNWTEVPDMDFAAAALGPVPRRVLLTVGRKDLAPFAAYPHHYVVRSVDAPPPGILPGCKILTARGPFTEAADRQLLTDEGIEIIVTKNSGGSATESKIFAARALRLPVIMVARPPWPDTAGLDATRVTDAPDAMRWLHQLAPAAERGV